jgi:signal transduction histidine kinase
MAVPLYDASGLELPRGHPARKPVAVLGHAPRHRLHRRRGRRDRAPVVPAVPDRSSSASRWSSGSRCGQTVVRPLRRLVEGIDAVAKGDLSRVILAERDDEIGTIAGRFNAMTGSLREAREEGERAASARSDAGGTAAPRREAGDHRPDGGEIAHELGTPLNVIGGRARTLTKKAGRRRRGREERRHHQRRSRAYHQDHPPGPEFLAARAGRR